MNTEETKVADQVQAADQITDSGTQSQNTGGDTAAMDEAAKEASLMLLDKILGKESKPNENTEENPVETPKAEAPKKPSKQQAKPNPEPEKKTNNEAEERVSDHQTDRPETKPRRKISAEKITELASKAAAEATAETLRKIEQDRIRADEARRAAQKEPDIEVPDDLKDEVDRLREVQRLHAKDYRGRDLVKEFVESSKKESEYQRKWMRENPGSKFDWNDDEHSEFIESNAIEVDEDHLKEAERSMLKEAAIREAEDRFAKKYGKDIEDLRRSRVEADLAPIRKHVDELASQSILEAIRPDLVETFSKDRAKVIEELKNDPIAVEAVSTVERWSVPALDAAVRVVNNPSAYNDKSPEVQTLVQAALHVDNVLSSIDREERPVTEDGRRFSTLRDYANMPASQRSKYYTVQDENLVAQLIMKVAQYEAGKLKTDLEKRAESYAKRMGFVKPESNSSQKAAPKQQFQQSAPSVRSMPSTGDDKPSDQSTSNGVPKAFWDSIGIQL